jgi:predicted nucleic acid-binding protein
MIIIDSSMWIEFFMGSKYGEIIKKNDSFQENNYIVPTIIVREVHKKLTDVFSEELADEYCYYLQNGQIVDLSFNLSLLSSKLSKTYKLPLADSIIYATAVSLNATLYTLDKHFKDLPNVNYFEK